MFLAVSLGFCTKLWDCHLFASWISSRCTITGCRPPVTNWSRPISIHLIAVFVRLFRRLVYPGNTGVKTTWCWCPINVGPIQIPLDLCSLVKPLGQSSLPCILSFQERWRWQKVKNKNPRESKRRLVRAKCWNFHGPGADYWAPLGLESVEPWRRQGNIRIWKELPLLARISEACIVRDGRKKKVQIEYIADKRGFYRKEIILNWITIQLFYSKCCDCTIDHEISK